MTLDLDSYLGFIGYDGPREASAELLHRLHFLHAITVPFENLDPLLGITPCLDVAALQAKLVGARRGGYCFELNGLFQSALRALGFQVTGLAARVVWMSGLDGPTQPRTHRLMRIDLDGETWLADVGFGGWTQTAPLRLAPGLNQDTPHEAMRIEDRGDGVFLLSGQMQGVWKPFYTFTFEPQADIDYELANHYVATHPESIFVNGLLAARPHEQGRFGLFNNALSVHHHGGNSDQSVLTAGEMAAVLQRDFKITLPDHPGLPAVLERLANPPAL